ncbi:major facilitator superfamily domain-containing protein [Dunaliella salina]|uniref:Major facilitator superfamily domain-containing protein n=1 Tax=Dunaliella salina TaxID=3046 RepID=A0ABQ7GPG1_DUNSA|nr:major facilitator superfamily domain-containing protein [Dunaliella salina]|eukprot:KAF5836492.1 major facilitator superfamily domain-containing protein [Dunaliella salina]
MVTICPHQQPLQQSQQQQCLQMLQHKRLHPGKARFRPGLGAPPPCPGQAKRSGRVRTGVARPNTAVSTTVEEEEARRGGAQGFLVPSDTTQQGPGQLSSTLPSKTQLVMACSLGFCLANMDKVNFTLAVIPMGLENEWTPTMVGLVQSAFFYGFLLMQIPGSILTTRLGGANVLPRGVSVWSTATACVPFFASNMPVLCGLRAITGLGEAIAPSSIVDIISRAVPPEERASSVSFAFSGLHLGSICGLLLSPAIISTAGWPSLFYLLGMGGTLWSLWFMRLVQGLEHSDPETSAKLLPESARDLSRSLIPRPKLGQASSTSIDTRSSSSSSSPSSSSSSSPSSGMWERRASQPAASVQLPSAPGMRQMQQQQQQQQRQSIPYRAFLRSHAVRVLMFTHFSHNWFHYTWLAWLPTYLTSTLSVDLTSAAHTALLPPVAGVVASAAAGVCGDGLVKLGVPTNIVRKLAQSVAFCVPTGFLAAAMQLPHDSDGSMLTVGCITAALGISSFSLAGLYCSHQDLSKRYASALLGLTNVAGSIPGIIGVALVGFLYDITEDWQISLLLPSATLLVAGAAVYISQSQHDQVDFDALDNSPFPPELWLQQRKAAVGNWFRQLLPGKREE